LGESENAQAILDKKLVLVFNENKYHLYTLHNARDTNL